MQFLLVLFSKFYKDLLINGFIKDSFKNTNSFEHPEFFKVVPEKISMLVSKFSMTKPGGKRENSSNLIPPPRL